MPFVFGNPLMGLPVLSAGIPRKKTVQGYWTAFATSGNPKGEGRPGESAYAPSRDESLVLDLRTTTATHGLESDCNLLDSIRLAPVR